MLCCVIPEAALALPRRSERGGETGKDALLEAKNVKEEPLKYGETANVVTEMRLVQTGGGDRR